MQLLGAAVPAAAALSVRLCACMCASRCQREARIQPHTHKFMHTDIHKLILVEAGRPAVAYQQGGIQPKHSSV